MKRSISTSEAAAPVGLYSQAVSIGSFVFCSGQIPLVTGDITAQTRRVMENIRSGASGKRTEFRKHRQDHDFPNQPCRFQAVNELYGSHFQPEPPARTNVQVAALSKGANMEIEVIAANNATAEKSIDTSQ